MVTCQHTDPGILDGVGILELIHQNMAKTLLVMGKNMGLVQPELMGPQQQLGKIHQPGPITGLLIELIELEIGAGCGITERLYVPGPQTVILLVVDVAHHGAGRPLLLVEIEGAHHPLDETQLIVAIEDLEILRQIGIQMMSPQQTVGNAVEGAQPHAAIAIAQMAAQQTLHPAAHLGGRLVGEGDGEDREGRGMLHGEQPGDTMHQYPRLAGASARQHQQIFQRRSHGIPLPVVEPVEQGFHVHHNSCSYTQWHPVYTAIKESPNYSTASQRRNKMNLFLAISTYTVRGCTLGRRPGEKNFPDMDHVAADTVGIALSAVCQHAEQFPAVGQ